MISCNCDYCENNEDGYCKLDNIEIEAQVLTPIGFNPMCNSFVDKE